MWCIEVVNPISISFAGIADKDVNASRSIKKLEMENLV
jgi:hypothetical protein